MSKDMPSSEAEKSNHFLEHTLRTQGHNQGLNPGYIEKTRKSQGFDALAFSYLLRLS